MNLAFVLFVACWIARSAASSSLSSQPCPPSFVCSGNTLYSQDSIEIQQADHYEGKVVVIEKDLIIRSALDLTNTELRVGGKIVVSGIFRLFSSRVNCDSLQFDSTTSQLFVGGPGAPQESLATQTAFLQGILWLNYETYPDQFVLLTGKTEGSFRTITTQGYEQQCLSMLPKATQSGLLIDVQLCDNEAVPISAVHWASIVFVILFLILYFVLCCVYCFVVKQRDKREMNKLTTRLQQGTESAQTRETYTHSFDTDFQATTYLELSDTNTMTKDDFDGAGYHLSDHHISQDEPMGYTLSFDSLGGSHNHDDRA